MQSKSILDFFFCVIVDKSFKFIVQLYGLLEMRLAVSGQYGGVLVLQVGGKLGIVDSVVDFVKVVENLLLFVC